MVVQKLTKKGTKLAVWRKCDNIHDHKNCHSNNKRNTWVIKFI